jgi:hypothetical protein
MKIVSVQLARALWFLEPGQLNPKGKNVFSDLVPAIVETFGFQHFPKLGDDLKDGVKFRQGTFTTSSDDLNVAFTIYNDALSAEASSTKYAEEFLFEVGGLGKDLGYVFEESMISKRAYVSQIVVQSDQKITSINPRLIRFSHLVSDATGLGIDYSFSSIEFWPDQRLTFKPAPFQFSRRIGDASFEDHYWSQAATTTDKHLELLNELEQILADS